MYNFIQIEYIYDRITRNFYDSFVNLSPWEMWMTYKISNIQAASSNW